jgi:hypothetical protein
MVSLITERHVLDKKRNNGLYEPSFTFLSSVRGGTVHPKGAAPTINYCGVKVVWFSVLALPKAKYLTLF